MNLILILMNALRELLVSKETVQEYFEPERDDKSPRWKNNFGAKLDTQYIT